MRWIDADTLKETLSKWNRNHWTEAFTGDDAASEFDYLIDQMDMIDTAPMAHAHWIAQYPNKRTGKAYHYACSKCGRSVYSDRQLSVSELGYDFCPHCGANMDEGEKNEND